MFSFTTVLHNEIVKPANKNEKKNNSDKSDSCKNTILITESLNWDNGN